MKTMPIICQHTVLEALSDIMQYIASLRLLYFPNFTSVSSTSIVDILRYSLLAYYT